MTPRIAASGVPWLLCVRARAKVSDVAKLAGVSSGTESNYLNRPKTVAPATAIRISEAIALLDFVPDDSGRALRQRSSNLIGVIVKSLGDPFQRDVLALLQDRFAAAGMTVAFAQSHARELEQTQRVNDFISLQTRGTVFIESEPIALCRSSLDRHAQPYVVRSKANSTDQSEAVPLGAATDNILTALRKGESARKLLIRWTPSATDCVLSQVISDSSASIEP